MSNRQSPARFPLAAVIGVGLPLAMVWVVLYLTKAVSSDALAAIGTAIVVLVIFVTLWANFRIRRGR